ncbi:MAG: nucleotidyl transferase AbiEii/AbiGii toxin family protein [Acidobacteriota bacterium]
MIETKKIFKEAETQGVSAKLIFKEHLHWLILDYLFKKGDFSHLVFQGGTALRFAYGGVRYSEDLDFVLTKRDDQFFSKLNKSLDGLPSYLNKFILQSKKIHLIVQKDSPHFKRFYLTLELDFLKEKDRTNIKIANVPSYQNKTQILKSQHLPISPAIVVETSKEILADKILAFGAREYLKGRDLWDIHFIFQTLGFSLDDEIKRIVRKKINDYELSLKNFQLKFKKRLSLLRKDGHSILKEEMDKFLPSTYRQLFQAQYISICQEEVEVLESFFKEF